MIKVRFVIRVTRKEKKKTNKKHKKTAQIVTHKETITRLHLCIKTFLSYP